MSILLPTPRSNQPDYPVLVDSSNQIANGLIVSAVMTPAGAVYDASRRGRNSNFVTSTNIKRLSGSSGTNLDFDGSQAEASVSFGTGYNFNGLLGLTIEADFTIRSIGPGNSTIVGKNGPDPECFLLYITSVGRLALYQYMSGGVSLQWQSQDNSIVVNRQTHVVASFRNQVVSLYINGRLATLARNDGTTNLSLADKNTIPLQIGRNSNGLALTGSISMVNIWSRGLSDAEAYSRYMNRWGLFAAPRGVSVTVSSITYTYARPSSDITTQWSTSSGTTHYTLIDETVADDNDYIVATAAGQTDEVKLASMTPPQVGTDLVINYKVTGVDGGATVTVSLRQGSAGTLIKTDTAKSANGTYALTVTPADWAVVTDWSDLRLRFVSA